MSMFLPKAIGALAIATLLSSSPIRAQTSEVNEPWCSTDRDAAMNCLYRTQAECESVMRAEGGECVSNPRTTFLSTEQNDDQFARYRSLLRASRLCCPSSPDIE